ncbi:MAG: HlyD family efflux transporter periplasmic adaptor subunit [Lewinellaceae bacterium]|nr:HlyD family efflux transporter periplasmic adaptor subunit [Lewinellaceae bacterium]
MQEERDIQRGHFAVGKVALVGFLLACISLGCGKSPDTASAPEASTGDEVVLRDTMEVSEVVGIAKIEPLARLRSINAEVSGVITRIRIAAGQHVEAGAIIVDLDDAVERAQVSQAQSRLGTQQAAIRRAQAVVATRQAELDKARADLQRNENLAAGKALTEQALADSRFQVEQLTKQLAEARVQVEQEKQRVLELEADIQYAQTMLGRRVIRAPLSGTFLSVDIREGTFLNNTTAIGDFAPDGPLMALTEVDELFASRVHTGLAVDIRNQGETDVLTTGKVVFAGDYLKKKSLFSGQPDELEDRRVREVQVELPADAPLLIGARVECVIRLDR